MNKVKNIAFLILFALLVLFTYENWVQPQPPLKFLNFIFPSLPYAVILYGSFLLGFLAGWLAHSLRAKKVKDTYD